MASGIESGGLVAGFRVRSLLGEGAMGAVYAAETEDGRRVALKLLAPQFDGDERFRKRFLRESRLAASLEHPHIVPTIDAGEVDGVLYLAMEHVEGADLRELLRREGSLEPERAVNVAAQVADALDAAHAAGLVHRDVKPANILVGADDRAYVCDFGLARHLSSVSSLTTDRGFVGTIDYIAPEQVEGKTVDGRADVYALGCVLFECLAGARPFERESDLAVVFAHLNEPPPRLTDVRPELPQALGLVLERALAKSPDDRYSTCRDLVDAVRAGLRGRVVTPRGRRRRYAVALAVALVAGAGAAGGVLATNGGSTHRVRAQITEREIDGVPIGGPKQFYEKVLGGYREITLTQSHFPALEFQAPQMTVYFPAPGKPAHIITTWNRSYRTSAGIGPCSTLAQLLHTYGKRATATWAGTQGKVHWSYALGNDILFVTQDHKTVADVVLYKGDPRNTHNNSPQAWANYIGADATACK